MAKKFDYIYRLQKFVELRDKYGKDFDPKKSYPRTKTSKVITHKGMESTVGKAFRIAEAMSLRQASKKDMERITRYLMVCIDSEKHHLDYHKAYEDLGVKELSHKYGAGMY